MVSHNQKRILAAVLFLISVFVAANYHFKLGIFGRFGKQVYIGTGLLLVICLTFMGAFDTRDRKQSDR
jgi:surface polysaccharide O-acyltransferase-like enzyme